MGKSTDDGPGASETWDLPLWALRETPVHHPPAQFVIERAAQQTKALEKPSSMNSSQGYWFLHPTGYNDFILVIISICSV